MLGIFLLGAETVAAGQGAPALPSLVSTNLCADLLVLRLAAPEQILALSRQSQALEQTELAARAGAYPSHRGSIEELLALKPDLVLAYAGWGGRRHGELLARQGIEIIEMPYPGSWEDALATARDLGARIGRAASARQVSRAAAARMRALAASMPPWLALYLRPNGGTAGAGTYVDDLLRLLGLRNLAREQGIRGWSPFPLEQLVMSPPGLILLGYFNHDQPLQASGLARHPLLRRILADTGSIGLPANGWGCGGLELLKAAEVMAAAMPPRHPTVSADE
ncbi:corrinoid ABC transporter substrate-binding protein [Thiorhodovibrio winogradskyi]|uniref:Corrinoid ABC transporter substrate-binding protein n=1 Tax=Thiorhodovibrio winogradskyi TaxID=77007 RepID=A0ABZ0SAK3_9GAMM|nr:ABC transporter substrate-binding protein [Thiorhodovibrio winogradskyi]